MQVLHTILLQLCTAIPREAEGVGVVGSDFEQHAVPRLLQTRPAYMHAWVLPDNIQPVCTIESDTGRPGSLEGAAQE